MVVKKAQFEETLMSQRMCLLYLKMQKMFFKFVPSLDLPINFWWCTAVDCGLTVWVHLSHDRYLECDRVGIYVSAAEVTVHVMIESATGLSQKLNSELS